MAKISSAITKVRDALAGAVLGAELGSEQMQDFFEAAETAIYEASEAKVAKESILQQQLWEDEKGWVTLTQNGTWDVTGQWLSESLKLSRMMYLMNPLIRRAVTLQELYVWGQGCSIRSATDDKNVQTVLDDFFSDPANQCVIGANWIEREREQRIDGNTFFVFFINKRNGRMRVRLIPVEQVSDIIRNPDDSKEVWFYVRTMPDGGQVLYPDMEYNPNRFTRIPSYQDIKINWDNPVMHVKTGGLSSMRWGLPELLAALPWATAYKTFLENFSTIMKAYARMAWKLTGGKKKDMPAAKSRLNTTVVGDTSGETNPSPNTASWLLSSGGMDLQPMKTANATTGPDEARAVRTMVAAGSDTPEHFFGDSDVGNFATSSTLDRPTELKMIARQNMWGSIAKKMAAKAVTESAKAPNGVLRKAGWSVEIEPDGFDYSRSVMVVKGPETTVTVKFPTILSRDIIDRVRAVVMAATMNGSKAEGIIPDRKFLFNLIATALGLEDVDKLTDQLYPETVTQGFVDPKEEFDKVAVVTAQGRKELGDAAMKQADTAKTIADKPAPKPTAVKKESESSQINLPEVVVNLTAPSFTIPEMKAPVVNFTPPNVEVNVPAPIVNVAAPIVNLPPAVATESKRRRVKRTLIKDKENRIIGSEEVEDTVPGSKRRKVTKTLIRDSANQIIGSEEIED